MQAMIAGFLRSFSILNTTDKRRKSVAIIFFILIAVSLLVMITTIFAASITFTLSLQEVPISDILRGEIACFIDQSGACTRCQEETSRCPEWGKDDVTKILQTQAKTGAAFAAIFVVYVILSSRSSRLTKVLSSNADTQLGCYAMVLLFDGTSVTTRLHTYDSYAPTCVC